MKLTNCEIGPSDDEILGELPGEPSGESLGGSLSESLGELCKGLL